MNNNPLYLLQKINLLLGVYDVEKAKILLEKASEMITASKDPYFKAMLSNYKDAYRELEAQLSQIQLDTNEDRSQIVYSNNDFSALIVLRNKYEMDIKIIVSAEFQWEYKKEHSEFLNTYNQEIQIEARRNRDEESETAVVYELSFPEVQSQFGEATFTSSGVMQGRIYSGQFKKINKESMGLYYELCSALFDLTGKVYKYATSDRLE